jgi:FkbM family methyltransferase
MYCEGMDFASVIRTKLPVSLKNALKDSDLNYFRLIQIEIRRRLAPNHYFGQTAEDVLIKNYLPEKRGTYIDIGAGRPISGSNTFGLYKRGWSGICVDPISFNCKLIRYFRPKDTVLNILVGSEKDLIDFWEFDPYEYSTADKKVAEKLIRIPEIRLLAKSQKEVRPLSEIVHTAGPLEPTLLSIDVEGFDLQVLKSNDWDKYQPRVICVEEWNSTLIDDGISEVDNFLRGKNYQRKAWTGLSSIYVDKTYLTSTQHWKEIH